MTSQGPDETDLLLPEGTRLVHIGPPKTGTTAVQGAFHAARTELLAHGIRYAGASRSPWRAAIAASSNDQADPGRRAGREQWQALLAEIRAAREPRIVISSEHFAKARPDAVRRITGELDRSAVHVAATLRPLARLLSSQWQQFVQGGLQADFEPWLRSVLDAGTGEDAEAFWLRHRHDELIARWADVLGPDRVTVIVVDDRDHGFVLRMFEELLGARTGCLVSVPDIENRSLTWPEAEAIRHLNVAFRGSRLAADLNEVMVLRGAALQMKLQPPSADAPRIEAPQWALDRAVEISREMVDRIAASGVKIVGDLERLSVVPAARTEVSLSAPAGVPPEVAASMAIGALAASGSARGRRGGTRKAAAGSGQGRARRSTGRIASAIGTRSRNALGRLRRRRR